MSVPKSIARPEQFPRHFLHEEVAGSQTGCKFKSQPYESQRHICLGVTHRFAQSWGSHKCPFLPSAWISEEFSPPLPFTSGLKGLHYCSAPCISYLRKLPGDQEENSPSRKSTTKSCFFSRTILCSDKPFQKAIKSAAFSLLSDFI